MLSPYFALNDVITIENAGTPADMRGPWRVTGIDEARGRVSLWPTDDNHTANPRRDYYIVSSGGVISKPARCM
jgi:hypothetical protein